jgi:hypothetical protein
MIYCLIGTGRTLHAFVEARPNLRDRPNIVTACGREAEGGLVKPTCYAFYKRCKACAKKVDPREDGRGAYYDY